MAKEITFFITDYKDFYNIVNRPIRTKEDIIRILLLSIKFALFNTEFDNEDKGEVIITIVDKTSRIYFICKEPNNLPNKYFSFSFPFFFEKKSENEWFIKCKTTSEIIDSELVDKLLALLDKGWFSDLNITSDSIDKFACDYLDIFEDYCSIKNITYDEKEALEMTHWSIIKNLLTFEPGYIRYDYDPDPNRLDENKHPLNHLDVYFSQNNTFKLGFDRSIKITNRLDFNKFKDILENGKSQENMCYRLK